VVPAESPAAEGQCRDNRWRPRFRLRAFPVTILNTSIPRRETLKRLQRKRLQVADTSKVEDKLERKKLKRAARKKASPKAPRTGARGEKKKKVKKLARGISKR
jgi:hypothetical protein